MAFNIFSTLKNNASQAIGGAVSAASNVAGTVSKNIQDFGGDVYHAVQSGKDMAGNIASTVSQNLQNFGGDVYKAQKSVTDYGTQKFDQAQQVGNQVKQNVGDWYTGQINEIKSIPNQIRKANYEAINAGLKSITGKDNAMWSDIAPILKDTLLERHGDYDKLKVSEAVSKLGQQGLSEDQIKQTLDAINKKDPNFFKQMTYTDKIRAGVAERGSEVAKTYRDFASGKIGFGEAAFRNAGDILGLGGNVAGNTITQIPGVEYGLQKVGQVVSAIPGVQQGMEAYGEFAKANPRAAQNLEALTNIGLSAAGSSEGQKLIGEGAKKVSQGVGKVTAPLKPIIKKASDSVSSGVGNIAESIGATATGLQRGTLGTVRKSPELFRQARKGVISRESVVDQTVGAIQKRLDDLSEIGSGYDKIKRGNIVASGDDISGVYLKNAGNVSTRQLTKADRSTLQDLSDYMSEYKGNITDADLLSLRRQIDSVLYDPTTGMPRKLTPQANKIVNDVRADINTMAKDRIKGLAELDAQYAPEVALLKKVKKDIFNSDGTLKDSAISTLANITGKGKEAKLTRLEKILPGLGDRVEAMKAYEDILNASGNKVGTYGRGALAAAGAFTINPSVIGAWVATHPRVVSFVLEKYGLSKKAIAEMVAKKKFSKSDANIISEALKSVGKSKVEKGIARGAANLVRKSVAPSPEKILKETAEKKSVIKKKQPATKTKSKSSQKESPFKNNKGFISPNEMSESAKKAGEKLKSIIPKKDTAPEEFYRDLVKAGNSPIVAQRETAKRFGTLRSLSASKAGTFGGELAKAPPKTGWTKGADGEMVATDIKPKPLSPQKTVKPLPTIIKETKPINIPKDIEIQANKAKNADEFINQNYFKVERNKGPSRSDYKITNANGYLEFSIDKDNRELTIDMVEAYKKGQGTGTKLIEMAEREADKRGLNVSFFAEPQDDTISKEGLLSFYENLGYENTFGMMDKKNSDLYAYRKPFSKNELKQMYKQIGK